ncbi:HAD-IB family hydrolase [Ornithinibacillus sp. L9]|uniref:HAD-IB family hydrolase n=1 Tax=Ornithinibacillus caprae TaxID=2678566 RepID=A0A6N8FKZ6_9BACI|nr:HAD-IB family hydrolase [Ornithinibacillus caprae]MUK87968.1 HAD-IB family hydrolase [Ornithinibacillus caprae]
MAIITVDFDGTLYQGNSFKVMFQVGKKRFSFKQWYIVSFGLQKAILTGIFKGKNAFRHQFFKAFAKTFKGKTTSEMDEFFQELVDIGKKEVHQDLVKQIKTHQENGDTIILLSGALHPFLVTFAHELQLDAHVLSTELMFDQYGICTGEVGPIINGNEKVKKVQAWLENENTLPDRDGITVWAYADSESDIPLLEYVDNPVVVNPNQDMKKIADQNRWPVFST